MTSSELRKEFDAATRDVRSICMERSDYWSRRFELNNMDNYYKWLEEMFIPRFLADKALAEIERLEKENKELKDDILGFRDREFILKSVESNLKEEIKELQGQLEEKEKQIEKIRTRINSLIDIAFDLCDSEQYTEIGGQKILIKDMLKINILEELQKGVRE